MNTLTVVANLAHRAALVRSGIGDPHGGVGNGLDRHDDFIQGTIGSLRLAGGRFGVFYLGAYAFY
ncbi:hypothetical protein D3C87_2055760 [compost metagenome]